VDVDEGFPTGCRITYRAFCAEQYVQIIENENFPCGLEAINYHVSTHPTNAPGGLFILQQLPSGKPLLPMPFTADGRTEFDCFFKKIKEMFRSQPDVIQQWNDWSTIIPASDDAFEYVNSAKSTWWVPLNDRLFQISQFNEAVVSVTTKNRSTVDELRQFYSTDSVQWSQRGMKSTTSREPWVDSMVTMRYL
jgi:hypothetical protein